MKKARTCFLIDFFKKIFNLKEKNIETTKINVVNPSIIVNNPITEEFVEINENDTFTVWMGTENVYVSEKNACDYWLRNKQNYGLQKYFIKNYTNIDKNSNIGKKQLYLLSIGKYKKVTFKNNGYIALSPYTESNFIHVYNVDMNGMITSLYPTICPK